MKNYPACCMIMITLLSSCGVNKNSPAYSWETVDNLSADIVPCDSVLLGLGTLHMYNDILFTHNPQNENWHFLYLKSQNDSLKFGNRFLGMGKGPMEALRAEVSFLESNNTMYIVTGGIQVSAFKCYTVNLDDESNITNTKTWSSFDFPTGNSIAYSPIADQGGFLTISMSDTSKMFGYYDIANSTIRYADIEYPKHENASNRLKGMVYSGEIRNRPGHQQFVYSSYYGQYVIILELENGELTNHKIIYNNLPEFDITDDGLNFRLKETVLYGFYPQVTEKYIYLFDCLSSVKDARARKPELSGTVLVFDWDGNPVRKLIIDQYIIRFTVDKNDEYLYFTPYYGEENEDVILRAKLKLNDKQ